MTRIVMSRLLGLSVGLFLSIVSPVDACTPVPMAFTMMGNILSGPLMLQMLGAVALVTALKVGLFWRANRGEISFFRLLGAIVAANVASTLYFLIAVIMMEAT
ncbi:MAG TPA: hypothetical protein PKO06_15805, partial [Candidatus Ozemobacteraceae bacterium]|nr:hypothetical protein [Candidatus Ozemobacteraceae bacterium]